MQSRFREFSGGQCGDNFRVTIGSRTFFEEEVSVKLVFSFDSNDLASFLVIFVSPYFSGAKWS